ncbi:lytic transglycosylase domain-containing protein [Pantoea allii]|uniref:lytic transglycosylase domain-containing protein n=1 Tax=Pantoea allii TaxID=574096 RepID=UPI003D311141
MKWLTAAAFFTAFSVQAEPEMCFTKAGHDFGIDPRLLMAHSIQESRMRNNAINDRSAHKSTDVCNMQINSTNFPKLKKFNITRERLLADPCICIYTGAWIEALNFKQYGRTWDTVGMYNTGPNPKLIKQRREYAAIIKSIYRVLVARDEVYAKMNKSGPPETSPPLTLSRNDTGTAKK